MLKKIANFKIEAYEMYRIYEKNEYFVVLAQNVNTGTWVTWECTNGEDFYWGHYFNKEEDARLDFHKRLAIKYTSP
jgi:hypothetical protein